MTIQEYLNKIYTYSGLTEDDYTIELYENEKRIRINMVVSDDFASIMIGSKGETLKALEKMVRIAFRQELRENDLNLILDINDYRQKRERNLQDKAVLIAQDVKETGSPYQFFNLNSYERYLVHKAVSEAKGLDEVTTFSENTRKGRVLNVAIDQGESQEETEKTSEEVSPEMDDQTDITKEQSQKETVCGVDENDKEDEKNGKKEPKKEDKKNEITKVEKTADEA